MKKNCKLTNELISPLSDFMDLFLMGGGGEWLSIVFSSVRLMD